MKEKLYYLITKFRLNVNISYYYNYNLYNKTSNIYKIYYFYKID